jgi:5-methylcytosine-specific restriction endonuclease McrA
MIDPSKVNDPEYRWSHKREMSEIMPYYAKRKEFGVKVLDYWALRVENNERINPNKIRHFNLNDLMRLVDSVPAKLDRSGTKKSLQPADRLHFESLDMGECCACGYTSKYNNYDTSCHLHHVDPIGNISDTNIVTLCVHCHQVVHHLLFLMGKWKYARPL